MTHSARTVLCAPLRPLFHFHILPHVQIFRSDRFPLKNAPRQQFLSLYQKNSLTSMLYISAMGAVRLHLFPTAEETALFPLRTNARD